MGKLSPPRLPARFQSMSLITLEEVTKGFNDRVLLDGVSFAVGEGERVGLLGANGSGKSSFLRILAGVDLPDDGRRALKRGLRLGYLEQDPDLDPDWTVREAARAGLAEHTRVLAEVQSLHAALAEASGSELDALLSRQSGLEAELERLGGYDVEHRVESTLLSLGLLDFEARCGLLSGGERRRVALAQLLLSGPELLLLDEPTNHLDAFVTEWLEDWFLETRTPLVLVTHDRYFLDRVVDRIVEIDRGELHAYEGGYGDYLVQRAARLEREAQAESARLNLLRRETAWMRRGAPARTTKAKARVQRYEELAAAIPTDLPAELVFEIPPGPRLGSRVLLTRGITKGYDGRTVVPPLDLELVPGDRLGIVGPNGAGKTTLVKLLLGELEPDGGEREVGETVRFMAVDQLRGELDPDATVAETLAGRGDVVEVAGRSVRVESFLDKWGFPKRQQDTPISRLSGGERGRILLAKLLCAGGNVLVLDEPTNDLDLPTLRALEEATMAFPGAAIVVSHDRWFLDRIATKILYLDGEGGMQLHYGDLSGLLEEVRERRKESARKASADARAEGAQRRELQAQQAQTAQPKAKRITPWQEKELAELEERIPVLEARLTELDERLADPALYTGPRSELDQVRAAREEADGELTQAFERWEELEGIRSSSA